MIFEFLILSVSDRSCHCSDKVVVFRYGVRQLDKQILGMLRCQIERLIISKGEILWDIAIFGLLFISTSATKLSLENSSHIQVSYIVKPHQCVSFIVPLCFEDSEIYKIG